MNKQRLRQIEEYVLGFFKAQQKTRILAKELFDSTSAFANADMVRALDAPAIPHPPKSATKVV